MRIGILEDDPTVRGTLYELLEHAGHTPTAYARGLELIDEVILDENTPILNVLDLVLVDMALPDISGVQVIDTLEKIYPQLPIIIISGGSLAYLGNIHSRYPKINILQKPFKFADLKMCIERATHKQKPERKKRGAT
jgi:FixJ family two-component response regulator